jgi:NitT/TauT family transport system substrate-binding protein
MHPPAAVFRSGWEDSSMRHVSCSLPFSYRSGLLALIAAAAMAVGVTSSSAQTAPAHGAGSNGRARLRVSLGDVSINKVPYIVAKEEGIFEKHGLDVVAFITDRAADVVTASGMKVPEEFAPHNPGPYDIAISGGSPTMVARTTDVREMERIILATTDDTVRWHVYARPGITRLEQLKGKRLGVSGYGSCSGFLARLIAQRMKWNPEQDLSIMYGSLGIKWLQDGGVDAVVLDETAHAYAASIGLKPIADLREWNEKIACSGVVARKPWLAKAENRELAKRFLMATVEAIAMMKKDPQVAHKAMTKWFGITNPQIRQLMLEGGKEMRSKPYPSVAGIKKVMEIFDYHEMRRYKLEEFYDDTLMREIDKSGFIDALYK